MTKRKICVVTATRSEYGLLKCLLEEIDSDSALQLQLIVTGTHLSPEFGMTSDRIVEDGFHIDKKVEMIMSSDTPIGVSKSMALAQIGFAEAYDEMEPDIVIVLGDRYELLPIVSAAIIAQIPVAHLNGGELTEGAVDELIRHAVTKLSHLHFTAIDEYSTRVIQMGEHPSRVFNVGEAGLDELSRINYLTKDDMEKSLGIKFKRKNLLITYHPETCGDSGRVQEDFQTILGALNKLENTLLIFTKANADVGGRIINSLIDDYVEKNGDSAIAFISLGRLKYLSALRFVDGVVGNSSSGIVEAPSFNIGTINIGERQRGRIRPDSVIDVSASRESMRTGLKRLYSKEFGSLLKKMVNPYKKNESSKKIKDIIKNVELDSLKKKTFHDIEGSDETNRR